MVGFKPRGRSVCAPLLFYGVVGYLLRLTGIFHLMGSAMEGVNGIF
jgi:hypothetical protein